MKRIATILLLMCSVVWGVPRTLYPDTQARNWSDSNWGLNNTGGGVQAKPTIEDTVIFDAAAADVTMDENSAVLVAFTMSAGTLDGNGNTLFVDGDVNISDGTLTAVILEQGEESNFQATNPSTGKKLTQYNLDFNADITLGATSYVLAFNVTSGAAFANTGRVLNIHFPGGNDFIDCSDVMLTGTVAITTETVTRTNAGTINCNFADFITDGNLTIQQNGSISATTTRVKGNVNGQTATLVLGATSSLGTVQLGSSTNKQGILQLNGQTVTITALSETSASGTGGLVMDQANITLSGTMNGTNITVTGNGVGGLPTIIEGGTVQNMVVVGAHVRAATSVDGGGNDNIQFFPAKIIGGGVF